MKLQIIETPDYILAVSEKVKVNSVIDWYYEFDNNIPLYQFTKETIPNEYYLPKVIAYQPKGIVVGLDLPLLPEMVVEDDVEKLADINGYHDTELDKLYKEGFRHGYKAATKVYSEEDFRKAIDFAIKYTDEGLTTDIVSEIFDIDCSGNLEETTQLFIQSLKQPKPPKWFVAETRQYSDEELYKITEFKTTKINGKTYLVGTYLYE